jgi:hypothetical protein
MGVGEELKGVEGIGGVGDEINLYKTSINLGGGAWRVCVEVVGCSAGGKGV